MKNSKGAPSRRAIRFLIVLLTLAIAVAVGGVIAATRIKSPADVAADARPPVPSVLTAPVISESVDNTLVFRGTVGKAKNTTAPMPIALPDTALTISKTPIAIGKIVKAGKVVLEVAGRPIIVLPGLVPAYRTLEPKDTGADVKQLQAALSELGYNLDVNGNYGPSTASAVTALYKNLGYVPLQAGNIADIAAAKFAEQSAESTGDLSVLTAQRAVEDAKIAKKQTDADANKQGAGAAEHNAVAAAEMTLTRAQEDLATAKNNRTTSVAAARSAYNGLVAASGPEVPLGEIMFVPELPATVTALSGSVGQEVQDPPVTVAAGSPNVGGRLDPASAQLVREGQQVQIDDTLRGITGTGQVTSVGELQQPAEGDTSAAYVSVTITTTLPVESVGDDVQLTINARTSRQGGLAVPVAAVFTRPDGQTYVTKIEGSAQTEVPVSTNASGDGQVAVTPATPGALKEGDLVVIGITGS